MAGVAVARADARARERRSGLSYKRATGGAPAGGSAPCGRIKLVSTYDPQAYGPTPFSPRDSQGSCQSAEQGDY
jgi:hypothetical protein